MARGGIELKSPDQFRQMRAAGLILASALDAMRSAARPGMTTGELDAVGAAVITAAGATSNFKGYHGFTGTICSSVNEEVVHGIPGDRVLADGDLISVDCGCILDGWHSDSAISFHIGDAPVPQAELDLVAACEASMWAGIAAIRPGGKLGEVTAAITGSVKKSGLRDGRRYGEVDGYGGHGIGSAMHMDPFVPNHGRQNKGLKLVAGMALAIEPMLTLGTADTDELPDGWTVVTTDGTRAAHTEHSVAILPDGICVLSAVDGGAAGLAPYGIVPVSLA